jgi:hypothetical protein
MVWTLPNYYRRLNCHAILARAKRELRKMKVINLIAGPGAGKSTNAFALMAYLKQKRFNCELVHEYAKWCTWMDKQRTLDDQLYVFAKQHHMFYNLRDQVDYVVTDSPLLLSLYYMGHGMNSFENNSVWQYAFEHLVTSTENMYENQYFFIERGDRKFVQAGRNQKEDECKEIDQQLLKMLAFYQVPYHAVSNVDQIINELRV